MACPLLKCVSPILTIKGCRNELGESHHALKSNHRFNLRLESPHPGLSKLPPIKITIHETVSDFQASPKFDPATKVGLMHRLQSCSAGNFLVGEEPPDGCRAVENTRKLSRWRHWAFLLPMIFNSAKLVVGTAQAAR